MEHPAGRQRHLDWTLARVAMAAGVLVLFAAGFFAIRLLTATWPEDVPGLEQRLEETYQHIATSGDDLFVGVQARPPGVAEEACAVRILSGGRVATSPRRPGVLRGLWPRGQGVAALRVQITAPPPVTVTSEVFLVDVAGAERVVFSGQVDLTGLVLRRGGGLVLYGPAGALSTTDLASPTWVPLPLGGRAERERLQGLAELPTGELLAVTGMRVLRYPASGGEPLAVEVLGRPTAALQFHRGSPAWIALGLEGRTEIYEAWSAAAPRLVTVVEGLHVHDVHPRPHGLVVTASGGFWGPLAGHVLTAPGDGAPAVELNVRLPLGTWTSTPWRGGLATATFGSVSFIPGVLGP